MKREFIVLCGQIVGNMADGFETVYGFDGERFAERQAAINHGFTKDRSDDFNIGVLEDDRLVSIGHDRWKADRDDDHDAHELHFTNGTIDTIERGNPTYAAVLDWLTFKAPERTRFLSLGDAARHFAADDTPEGRRALAVARHFDGKGPDYWRRA